MLIYTVGCSHTNGTETAIPDLKKTYPHVLENWIDDARMINHSVGGASNDCIHRLGTHDILTSPEVPDVVIAQWTHLDRFETPTARLRNISESDNKATLDHMHQQYRGWFPHTPESVAKRADAGSRFYDNAHVRFYKDFFVPYYEPKAKVRQKQEMKLLTLMNSFDSLAKQYGVDRVVHIPFQGFKFSTKTKLYRATIANCEFLFDKPWIGLSQALLNENYKPCEIYIDKPGKMQKEGHFQEDAHEQIALWLWEKIVKDNEIVTEEEAAKINDDFVESIYDIGGGNSRNLE